MSEEGRSLGMFRCCAAIEQRVADALKYEMGGKKGNRSLVWG